MTKRRRLVLANYSDPSCATLEAALIKSGYSEKRAVITACELRRDPEFIAATERKMSQKLATLECKKPSTPEESVIADICDIDAEAKSQGPVAAFLAIRLKAQELRAKLLGMFVERVEFGFASELAKEIEAARERRKLAALPALVIEGGTETGDN